MDTSNYKSVKLLYGHNYIPGLIVDDGPADFMEWNRASEEFNLLKNSFNKSNLMEAVCILIEIFQQGIPNSMYLAKLFGDYYDYKEGELIARYGLEEAPKINKENYNKEYNAGIGETDEDDKVVIQVKDIESEFHGIEKAELKLDNKIFVVNDIYLYVQDFSNLNILKADIKRRYKDVSIDMNNEVIISGDTLKIIILKVN